MKTRHFLFLALALFPGCTCRSQETAKKDLVPQPSASASTVASVSASVDAALAPPTTCTVNVADKKIVSAPNSGPDRFSLAAIDRAARVAYRVRAPMRDVWRMAEIGPTVEQKELNRYGGDTQVLTLPSGFGSVHSFGANLTFTGANGDAKGLVTQHVTYELSVGNDGEAWLGLATGPEVSCGAERCVINEGHRTMGHLEEDGRRAYVAVVISGGGNALKTQTLYDKRCEGMPKQDSYVQSAEYSDYCKDAFLHRAKEPAIAMGPNGALAAYRIDDELWVQPIAANGTVLGGRRKAVSDVTSPSSLVSSGDGFDVVVSQKTSLVSFHVKGGEPAAPKTLVAGREPHLARAPWGSALAWVTEDGALHFGWTASSDEDPTAHAAMIASGTFARAPRVVIDDRAGFLAWIESPSEDAGNASTVVVAPISCR
ncbi:MAG: hypothetical protein ACXVEF_28220 [Polyangiales bacterium]